MDLLFETTAQKLESRQTALFEDAYGVGADASWKSSSIDRMIAQAPELPSLTITDDAVDSIEHIKVLPGVSPSYRAKAEAWWKSVPAHIRKMASDAGIDIKLADNAKQIDPNADKIPARGHEEGETIAQQPGFYWPKTKSMVMVEHHAPTAGELRAKAYNESKAIKDFGAVRTFSSFKAWHELGHALDYAVLNRITDTKEWDDAFRAGLARVNAADRLRWLYYVRETKHDNSRGAKEELFAQLFAHLHQEEKMSATELRFVNAFKEAREIILQKIR